MKRKVCKANRQAVCDALNKLLPKISTIYDFDKVLFIIAELADADIEVQWDKKTGLFIP